MKRREFITLVGGAAAWPVGARAQQTMPVIGFLRSTSAIDSRRYLEGFQRGLRTTEFIEGKNVAIEYRWADGHYDRLPALVADLVQRHVQVLFVAGNPSAQAAKAVGGTTAIVFAMGDDPVKGGLVSSFNRPGGNITGISFFAPQLEGKRLGLLHELAPKAAKLAAIVNPQNPPVQAQTKSLREAAQNLGLKLEVLNASNDREIDAALSSLTPYRDYALMVAADPFLFSRRERFVEFAVRHAVPAIYEERAAAELGGLASYGTDVADAHRQAGLYAGRILKGEKPADIPVIQSDRFEFVLNIKAARALGLDISPTLSARADEVIE
jgi:putative ABC transport system substrate-binding protein